MAETTGEQTKDPPFWSKTSWIQIGYSLWVNQVVVVIGLSFGFSAVALPQLRAAKPPFLSSPDELSWIVSILLLTAPVGCLISGFLMDRIGRRMMLVFCLVPMVIGWLYTGFANSATHMIVGRCITGIGVGLCAGVPRTFCTEITLPNIRGVVGVIPTMAIGIGISVEGLLGSLYGWKILCFISGTYASILMVLNILLPETPYFVLLTGDMNKTMLTLKRIRAKEYNVDRELAEMQCFQIYNNIRKLPVKDVFWEICKPHARKPFTVVLIYILIGQLSGISIMMFWTVDIIKASRSTLDPFVGNVILGVTRMMSTVGISILLFWVRRRPLAIGSALGIGVLFIGFGVVLTLKLPPSIIPQIVYILYMAMASLGYYSLPLMMLYELLPLQIRGFLGGITIALVFTIMFIVNKLFPLIRSGLGFPGTIIMFGFFSLVGFVFLYFFLPETKGLTLQDIEEFYRGRRLSLKRESMTIRQRFPSILRQLPSRRYPRKTVDENDDQEFKRQPSVSFIVNNRTTMPGKDEEESSREETENTTSENKSENLKNIR